MLEVIGIVLTIIGLVFAFEAPRKWLIERFRRLPPVEHKFAIYTVFHTHNDGKELGPLGSNKTDKRYVLTWVVRNCADDVIQFERGIVMQQRENDHAVRWPPSVGQLGGRNKVEEHGYYAAFNSLSGPAYPGRGRFQYAS